MCIDWSRDSAGVEARRNESAEARSKSSSSSRWQAPSDCCRLKRGLKNAQNKTSSTTKASRSHLQTSERPPARLRLLTLLGEPIQTDLTPPQRLLTAMPLHRLRPRLPPHLDAALQLLLVLLELFDLGLKSKGRVHRGGEALLVLLVELAGLVKTLVEHAAGGLVGGLEEGESGARLADGDRASAREDGERCQRAVELKVKGMKICTHL